VDGAAVSDGVIVSSTHVNVSRALLATTGEHTVRLKTASGLTFYNRIVTVQQPISGVLLSPDNDAIWLRRIKERLKGIRTYLKATERHLPCRIICHPTQTF